MINKEVFVIIDFIKAQDGVGNKSVLIKKYRKIRRVLTFLSQGCIIRKE